MRAQQSKPAAGAKYLTIRQTKDRLGVSRSFINDLVTAGMLDRVYLPSPPGPDGQPRRQLPRITLDSIDRYERGEAVAKPTPATAASKATSTRRAALAARVARFQPRVAAHFR